MPERGTRVPLEPRWTAVVGLATLLFFASLVPVSGSTPAGTGGQGLSLFALGHLVGYAALAGALARALWSGSQAENGSTTPRTQNSSTAHRAQYRSTARLLAVAFLVTVAYSVGIEGLQGLVATRSFSYDDIAVNVIGAALGSLAGNWSDD